jgi:hypothetical protein
MFYNSETNVYMFMLTSEDQKGYKAHEREEISDYYIPDGVYYIVGDNGTSYVLSDRDGTKQVLEQGKDDGLYAALMAFSMGEAVSFDFLTGSREAEYSQSYSFDGGEYYYRRYRYGDTAVYAEDTYLISYKNKPVQYERSDRQQSELTFQFVMDFYYDSIPEDAPTPNDWQSRGS